VQIFGEVFQGVPFLFELLRFAELLNAWEFWRGGAHYRFLLCAVYDELSTDHGDIEVEFGLVLVSGAL